LRWLAVDRLDLDQDQILSALVPYRPVGLTSRSAITNLRNKAADESFRNDIVPLVRELPAGYDIDEAVEVVIEKLLMKLDG